MGAPKRRSVPPTGMLGPWLSDRRGHRPPSGGGVRLRRGGVRPPPSALPRGTHRRAGRRRCSGLGRGSRDGHRLGPVGGGRCTGPRRGARLADGARGRRQGDPRRAGDVRGLAAGQQTVRPRRVRAVVSLGAAAGRVEKGRDDPEPGRAAVHCCRTGSRRSRRHRRTSTRRMPAISTSHSGRLSTPPTMTI